MKKLVIIVLIIGVVFGVWLFIKQPAQAPEAEVIGQETAESAPSETAETDENDGNPRESTLEDMMPPADAAVKEFTVTGSNFTFDLKSIEVEKGDTVKLTFINSDGRHDWRLDEFDAATEVLSGGQQEVVTFVADKVGSFEYYCSVGTHRAMGMKGTLTVTQ